MIAERISRHRAAFAAKWALLVVVLSTGCRTAIDGRDRGMRYGPPPPGHVRIVGEPVPNWVPTHKRPLADAGPVNPLNWFPMGPRPILNEAWSGGDDASGRVVSIAAHPLDGDIAYAASASGGIWKTTDGGLNWEPKTDDLSILNHGCVVIDPSNPETVYAGTGEYTTLSAGDGLFRSTDGGATWERIATTSQVGNQCSRIVVDPSDPNVIHLTGSGGYARSIDGGNSWTKPLGSGRCSDVAINPVDPTMVYVGRHSDGIHRSLNRGATFTKLTGGLPTSNISRILVSVAASNPSVIYGVFVNNSSGLEGLYRSDNGGATWIKKINTPNFPHPQGWYDCFVGVDPTDENVVYCGGVFPTYAVAGVIKTTDGGLNWTDITFGSNDTQLHPDQHSVTFGPDGRVWVGNDGGIWTTDDGGDTWNPRNNRLMITQNYTIAVHPTIPTRMMGGTQDNGTVGRDFGTDQWPQVVAGDGGFLAYDFDNPSRRYTTYVELTVYRLGPGTAFANITGPWDDDPVNFIAPLVMDPGASGTLLGGTHRIWRTTTATTSATWVAISTSTVSGGGTINAIAVGPDEGTGASNNIYSGSSTGRVYVTDNGSTWNNRSTGLPTNGVSDIVVSPTDADVAYVTHYRSTFGRIFKTTNAGVGWSDITGALPGGVTPQALSVDWDDDPPGLYVGSGAGVWVSLDEGQTWVKDGADLPNVNIGDLYIDPIRREITAGTYGRGAWRSALPVSCNGPGIAMPPQPVTACNGDPVMFTVDADGDGPLSYQWFRNGQPIPGAVSSGYAIEPVHPCAAGQISVRISNVCGELTSDAVTLTVNGCGAGDTDADTDVDARDAVAMQLCFTDSGGGPIAPGCAGFDFDGDDDVDAVDWCSFQRLMTEP